MLSFKYKTVSWHSKQVSIPGVPLKKYNTEMAFQTYCADWLRKQAELTGLEAFKFWHHSANERIGAKAGFYAKMMGQSKGWPDFVNPGLACAIELKVLGGVASPDQKKWLKYLKSCGWHTYIIDNFEEFQKVVLKETYKGCRGNPTPLVQKKAKA